MTEARITQLVKQGLVQADPQARVTQLAKQAVVKVVAPRPPGEAIGFQTATTSPRFTASDPHWKNVALLLNGSSGLRDRSRHHLTGAGDRACGPYPDPTISWLGTPLFCVNRNTTGFLIMPPTPKHFALRGKPFTIEGWVRAPLGSGVRGIAGQWAVEGGLNDSSWALYLQDNVFTFAVSSTGTVTDVILSGTTLVANTWTHFCVERDAGGKLRMYINGAMVSSTTYTSRFHTSAHPLSVMKHGWDSEVSRSWGLNGYLQDLRITRNVARYASDAGFTVPAAPYPFQAFDGDPVGVDPHWDKVTCLINAEQDPVVDLKRGATLTGITRGTHTNENRTNNSFIIGATGSVAHVDNQFAFGLRTEPFTLELDVNHPRGGNSGYDLIRVNNCFRVRVTRGGIFVQYWNGGSWIDFWGIGWRFSGLDPTSFVNTLCITRDEAGVWRCWRNGQYQGAVPHPLNMGTGESTDLSIGVAAGDGTRLDNLRLTWGVARYVNPSYPEDPTWAFPYPLVGPASPPAPAASYPYEMPVPEPVPGVEAGWVATLGSAPTVSPSYDRSVPDGPTRNLYRWAGGASGTPNRGLSELQFPIPPQFWADVDAGLVYFDFEGEGGVAPESTEFGCLTATARPSWTAAPTRRAVSAVTRTFGLAPLSGRLFLPSGTRVVSLGFIDFRGSTARAFVAAQLKGRLTKNEPVKRFDFPEPVLADWVDAKGSTPINWVLTDFWNLDTVVTTGNTHDLREVFTLPEAFHDEIDAGQAAFAFEGLAFLNSADTGDFGRTYIEFLDGSDAVVGLRKWDAHTPYIPATIQTLGIAAPIPPTARKAVIGIFGSKDYTEAQAGTGNASFHVRVLQPRIYLPEPGQMPAAAPTPPTPTVDEHWEKVRCLISTRNGVIENLAPVDTRRIQANGNVVVASLASPFGTTAMSSNLTGASIGTDWLEVELYGPDIGPVMTVEGWFMKTARSARTWEGIHNQLSNGADQPATPMRMDGAARADIQLAFNEWYHIALCRNADGRGRVFVNGKRQLTESNLPGLLWSRLFRLFVYDAASTQQSSWAGYIDEFRITEGVERYTEDFTPPGNRFPAVGPASSLLLSGGPGELLLTPGPGGLLLSGDDYVG